MRNRILVTASLAVTFTAAVALLSAQPSLAKVTAQEAAAL
jgi:hypothetical protein